jgi:ABC-type transporter Mla maintaining outer membrane lipid asymmetry ATPase subunit MlaF
MEDLSCRFRGRISVIAGASGSGKTTLLRMIACLIRPQRGTISADGAADLSQLADADLAAFRRRIGMLFQGGALLDSMSIFDNVARACASTANSRETRSATRCGASSTRSDSPTSTRSFRANSRAAW